MTTSESKLEPNRVLGWGVYGTLLLCLLYLFIMVVRPFIEPFIWAVIVVLMTRPIYLKLISYFKVSETIAAGSMTFLLAATIFLAVVPLSFQLGKEARGAVEHLTLDAKEASELLSRVPYLGGYLSRISTGSQIAEDKAIVEQVLTFGKPLGALFLGTVQGVIRSAFNLSLAVFFCFFMYRFGPNLFHQTKTILFFIGGPQVLRLIRTARETVRGTMYGTIVTALAQGLLMGIGSYVIGTPVPALLGFATLILSFIPFGAPLVYLPVAAYMAFAMAEVYRGLILAIWGVAVVSTADNILRPIFISQATRVSFLLVFTGVIGGVMSFGLLGIVIGPTIMAVVRGIWLEFVMIVDKERQ